MNIVETLETIVNHLTGPEVEVIVADSKERTSFATYLRETESGISNALAVNSIVTLPETDIVEFTMLCNALPVTQMPAVCFTPTAEFRQGSCL